MRVSTQPAEDGCSAGVPISSESDSGGACYLRSGDSQELGSLFMFILSSRVSLLRSILKRVWQEIIHFF